MEIDLLSLFPEYFQGPFDVSMLRRARDRGFLEIRHTNIRDFAENKQCNRTKGTHKNDLRPSANRLVVCGSGGIYYGPLVYADYGQGTVQGFTVQGNLFMAHLLDGVPLDKGLAPLSPRSFKS